ncbi:hypothetical protein RSAG8_05960, partial [Rhizoctonia solani AG-8 WAC10335]
MGSMANTTHACRSLQSRTPRAHAESPYNLCPTSYSSVQRPRASAPSSPRWLRTSTLPHSLAYLQACLLSFASLLILELVARLRLVPTTRPLCSPYGIS